MKMYNFFPTKLRHLFFFQWRKWANLIFFNEKCDIKFGEIVFTAKVVLLFILSTANHFLALESLETIVWTSTHAFWEVNFLCSQWLFRCRKRYNRTCFIKPHFYAFLHLKFHFAKGGGCQFLWLFLAITAEKCTFLRIMLAIAAENCTFLRLLLAITVQKCSICASFASNKWWKVWNNATFASDKCSKLNFENLN